MAKVTINNGDSGSTVRTAINGMFTELYGESNFPQVATYADLPVASSFSGATYEVTTSTGTFLVNRKSAGLYRSNGTTWIYLGDINTDAATTGNTPAGNISATTVQDAINELDTEKAIAGAVTSSGLTMATGKLLGRSTASTGAIEELSTVPAANFPALTGDITTAGGALATTIGAGKVTLAMQANMATASLVYRKTAGSGAPEVNTLATLKTDLGLTGTNSGDQTITLTGNVTGSGTGSFATTIAASAVTLAMQADMATASVVYRKTAGAGAPEVQTLATLKADLGLTGTNSGDSGTVTTVSVTTANGVSGSVATATTTPAITLTLGAITPSSIAATGVITSSSASAGVGYATGAGSTVTQATSKSTGVTLNNVCGQITMNNAALAASTNVGFTFTNSRIAATDVVLVNISSGNTTSSYYIFVDSVVAGSCHIFIRNVSAGSLSEALVLNFVVIKAVAA